MNGAPIELVLLKQVAGYLAMPVFVVDEHSTLEYYNEPAEALLGQRYEETGQIPLETWAPLWSPTDSDGRPLSLDELPLPRTVRERRPVTGSFTIRGLDGRSREITVTALPLEGVDRSHLGAFAIFWEKADGASER